ncbi:MAG: hypothetical protein KDH96_07170 [Candidatus Riesia sp.]|nr:hypothetical protein [Candidatus Riesia sp.]
MTNTDRESIIKALLRPLGPAYRRVRRETPKEITLEETVKLLLQPYAYIGAANRALVITCPGPEGEGDILVTLEGDGAKEVQLAILRVLAKDLPLDLSNPPTRRLVREEIAEIKNRLSPQLRSRYLKGKLCKSLDGDIDLLCFYLETTMTQIEAYEKGQNL